MKDGLTFGEYLKALASNDFEKWIIDNKTKGGKFAKYKAASIMKKATEEGYCPTDEFRVYREPEEMVFGQFIFLETAITSNEEIWDKMYKFATYILRPIYDENFDNEDIEKESLHYQNVLNHPCENVLRVINKYMDARNVFIHNKYNGVFYKVKDEDEEKQEEEDSNVDNSEDTDGQWYWYSLIRTLSGNLHKHEETLMLKMSVVAPEIAYLRYVEQKEQHERKLQELKMKAKHGTY